MVFKGFIVVDFVPGNIDYLKYCSTGKKFIDNKEEKAVATIKRIIEVARIRMASAEDKTISS